MTVADALEKGWSFQDRCDVEGLVTIEARKNTTAYAHPYPGECPEQRAATIAVVVAAIAAYETCRDVESAKLAAGRGGEQSR